MLGKLENYIKIIIMRLRLARFKLRLRLRRNAF